LALKWLQVKKVEKIIIKMLKLDFGLGRNLRDSFAKIFYRLNIQETLENRKYDIKNCELTDLM